MNAIVKAKGLTKQYRHLLAVDHVDLEVFEGEIFGLLGPNGAGKTTTIRMLTGQTKPTSGEALIAGHDIIHEPIKAKESVGVVPEVSNVYDEMSAWDNLVLRLNFTVCPEVSVVKGRLSFLSSLGFMNDETTKWAIFQKA
jgi:ABC-2 type transport system ATP-binding protein